jgi:hypothetical protein
MDAFDVAVVLYLASHIPITLLVDAQAVLPKMLYPDVARDVVQGYATQLSDVLMSESSSPAWFKAIVTCEVGLQLPYFFFALYCYYTRKERVGPLSMRTATMVYGAHVATTLVPILGVFFSDPACAATKWILTAIYSPYLLMPLLMLWRAASRDEYFGPAAGASAPAGRKGGKGQ